MFDSLSEAAGCDLLAKLFRARGYTVARNLQFREYGVEFHVDGWDAKARVGFEYLTSEDEDHDDLSLVEYQALMEQQRRGELSLFVLDEVEPISAADLEEQANEFLDEVEAALDDVNLGRLLDVLEELRENSQLIVITHQKRTMEIADALYGVSMRGDGVTHVISQRLRERQAG